MPATGVADAEHRVVTDAGGPGKPVVAASAAARLVADASAAAGPTAVLDPLRDVSAAATDPTRLFGGPAVPSGFPPGGSPLAVDR